MNILKLEKINKVYKTKNETINILKNVDLEINKGDFISIIGKSGSGKTTLLNIIGLLDEKTNGILKINGEIIDNLDDRQLSKLRNKKIGFVFQFHHLLNEFTALENVYIPALISGLSKSEIEKKAKELLEMVGLGHRIHHKPDKLSGGEKQRVAIARALINSPDIILADEPTGNLDLETSDLIHQLFRKINKEYNQTIIVVTHSLEFAKLTDYIYEIRNGVLCRTN